VTFDLPQGGVNKPIVAVKLISSDIRRRFAHAFVRVGYISLRNVTKDSITVSGCAVGFYTHRILIRAQSVSELLRQFRVRAELPILRIVFFTKVAHTYSP